MNSNPHSVINDTELVGLSVYKPEHITAPFLERIKGFLYVGGTLIAPECREVVGSISVQTGGRLEMPRLVVVKEITSHRGAFLNVGLAELFIATPDGFSTQS